MVIGQKIVFQFLCHFWNESCCLASYDTDNIAVPDGLNGTPRGCDLYDFTNQESRNFISLSHKETSGCKRYIKEMKDTHSNKDINKLTKIKTITD